MRPTEIGDIPVNSAVLTLNIKWKNAQLKKIIADDIYLCCRFWCCFFLLKRKKFVNAFKTFEIDADYNRHWIFIQQVAREIWFFFSFILNDSQLIWAIIIIIIITD